MRGSRRVPKKSPVLLTDHGQGTLIWDPPAVLLIVPSWLFCVGIMSSIWAFWFGECDVKRIFDVGCRGASPTARQMYCHIFENNTCYRAPTSQGPCVWANTLIILDARCYGRKILWIWTLEMRGSSHVPKPDNLVDRRAWKICPLQFLPSSECDKKKSRSDKRERLMKEKYLQCQLHTHATIAPPK